MEGQESLEWPLVIGDDRKRFPKLTLKGTLYGADGLKVDKER